MEGTGRSACLLGFFLCSALESTTCVGSRSGMSGPLWLGVLIWPLPLAGGRLLWGRLVLLGWGAAARWRRKWRLLAKSWRADRLSMGRRSRLIGEWGDGSKRRWDTRSLGFHPALPAAWRAWRTAV